VKEVVLFCSCPDSRREAKASGGRPAFLKNGRARPAGSKKVLISLASACPDRLAQVSQKFFGSFFQKRTAFCYLALLGVLTFRRPGQLPFFKTEVLP
jgi:hypothetical protein